MTAARRAPHAAQSAPTSLAAPRPKRMDAAATSKAYSVLAQAPAAPRKLCACAGQVQWLATEASRRAARAAAAIALGGGRERASARTWRPARRATAQRRAQGVCTHARPALGRARDEASRPPLPPSLQPSLPRARLCQDSSARSEAAPRLDAVNQPRLCKLQRDQERDYTPTLAATAAPCCRRCPTPSSARRG